MTYIQINHAEAANLLGLPYLQQVTYLLGIRPYMDRRTCIVGTNRSISYQSLSDLLYIKPHSGISSGKPSRQQIRRVVQYLEKIGLIKIQSEDKHLILKCLLAHSEQDKASTEVGTQPDTRAYGENPITAMVIANQFQKADTEANTKAATPLYIDNNYYIYLSQQFEKFWESYPLKKSKQNAWMKFQSLQPTEELLTRIFTALEEQISFYNQVKSQDQWIPEWKYPANWLAQHCWEDEINPNTPKELNHATHQKRSASSQSCDPFWDSCKNGAEPDVTNNVIELSTHRKT